MSERWHVSKEVPLMLVASILVSAASGIWYASATSARIVAIEEAMKSSAGLNTDIVVLKEQVRQLERITSRLEAVTDRRSDASGGKSDMERSVQ